MSHSVDSSPKIASKFRSHVSSKSLKESHHILKWKLTKCNLSKSATELQYRSSVARNTASQSQHDREKVQQQHQQQQQQHQHPSTSACYVNQLKQQDLLAKHAIVVQKTQAFFASLKERWSNRNRSREHHQKQSAHERVEEADDGSVTEQRLLFEDSLCLKRAAHYSESCYSADNSSEHSSSVTPQSHSPYHKTAQRRTVSSLLRKFGVAQSMDTNFLESNDISTDTTFQDCINGHGSDDDDEDSKSKTLILSKGLMTQVDEGEIVGAEETISKHTALRQYSFYHLRIFLKCGRNLIAKDKNGSSDPYVKFKINGKLVYKSKTIYRDLNPVWEESFVLPVEDPFVPVHVKVFDYDWGLQDDFIGAACLNLTELDFEKPQDLVLKLEDTKGTENLGEILLTAILYPRTQQDKEQVMNCELDEWHFSIERLCNIVMYYQRNVKLLDANKRLKSQIWSSVVTIVLIKGTNLIPMDSDGYSDPYVKFRLGNEKYKSKVSYKTLNPTWLEQFDLHLYEDHSQELEITVWDKDWTTDDFMGRCTVMLDTLERELTHKIVKELEEGCGSISLLLTISGTTASETISDLTTYEEDPKEFEALEKRYALSRTFHNLKDVGHLTVKIYKAQGLASADICGKSDPFCVVELVNARLQTQTEYKTLSPSWQKIFTFNVKDIHSLLEVTVYDEDKDHKVEFLGKVAIPLLSICNNEKRWYALKDKKLLCHAKGNMAQILLEMNLIWNPLRACIRTLNPKEEKYMQGEIKFKRQVFVQNVMRLKSIILYFIELSKFIQSCFEWESYIQSMIAFIIFILVCHYAEPYMVPICLLLIFAACCIVQKLAGSSSSGKNISEDEDMADDDDDDDDDDKYKEEKKTLKERLQAIQEVTQTVQNSMGYIASLCESVKNTFNFTIPFLSYLAIILLISITVVLYFIPVRYLIMIWGINKFSRKLLRPNTIPNNEFLDFLSRVPNDEDLATYRELKIHSINNSSNRRTKKSRLS